MFTIVKIALFVALAAVVHGADYQQCMDALTCLGSNNGPPYFSDAQKNEITKYVWEKIYNIFDLCDKTYVTSNGINVCVSKEKYKYGDMKGFCAKFGGTPAAASVRDKNIKDELVSQMNIDAFVWVGLDDLGNEGTFKYADGVIAGPETDWGTGQPDNYGNREHCAHLRTTGDDRFNDLPCGNKNLVLCEFSFN